MPCKVDVMKNFQTDFIIVIMWCIIILTMLNINCSDFDIEKFQATIRNFLSVPGEYTIPIPKEPNNNPPSRKYNLRIEIKKKYTPPSPKWTGISQRARKVERRPPARIYRRPPVADFISWLRAERDIEPRGRKKAEGEEEEPSPAV